MPVLSPAPLRISGEKAARADRRGASLPLSASPLLEKENVSAARLKVGLGNCDQGAEIPPPLASRTASVTSGLRSSIVSTALSFLPVSLAWASHGLRKGKEARKSTAPRHSLLCSPFQHSISGHPGEDAEKATVKLARPASYCARLSATVGATSCEHQRAELAGKAKCGDPGQLPEGGD